VSKLSRFSMSKMIAGAATAVAILAGTHGIAAAADSDAERCLSVEVNVEALERIGACSRTLEAGVSGKDLVTAHLHRGMSYGQLGQMDTAIQDFTAALEADKANVTVWIARSRAYFHKQEHDLAMIDLAEAIKLEPQNAVALNLMGKNHFMLGNFELSIKFFNQAIDLDPNYYNAFVNRATTFYRDNKLQDAMRDVNAAYLMLPPGDTRGRALLQLKVAIEQAFASQQRANQQTN
jgi:tetratricopeptide (TPR) repeat protein